jgi:hypothetical protein
MSASRCLKRCCARAGFRSAGGNPVPAGNVNGNRVPGQGWEIVPKAMWRRFFNSIRQKETSQESRPRQYGTKHQLCSATESAWVVWRKTGVESEVPAFNSPTPTGGQSCSTNRHALFNPHLRRGLQTAAGRAANPDRPRHRRARSPNLGRDDPDCDAQARRACDCWSQR